jgi:hypothetical protein
MQIADFEGRKAEKNELQLVAVFRCLLFRLFGFWGGVEHSPQHIGFCRLLRLLLLRFIFHIRSIVSSSKKTSRKSLHDSEPPRLSFSSQEDALNYARHVVEDSKRRLAAYNLIERYIEGDYYIVISEWYRVGGNDKVYDLIFSSVPPKLGYCCWIGGKDAFDFNIGNKDNLGISAMLISDTYIVECPEKIVPSFVWLERAKKRYDVRMNIPAPSLNHGLQSDPILAEGEISPLRVGDSRGDSNGISHVVKGIPKIKDSLFSNESEIIREGFSKPNFVQIINSLTVKLYNIGPVFCIAEKYLSLFKGKNVFLCARET